MLTNYWNIACRTLLNHKSYVLINVLGLALAVASSIIIILYARHELSYDAFHVNADRIQLVYKERNTAQGIQELDDTWYPLLDVMKSQVPGVANGVRIAPAERWVEAGETKYHAEVLYADPSLFDVFSFPLSTGDARTALSNRNTVVLSQAMATRFFGNEDPLGKTLTINFVDDYRVSGVFAPIPANSSIVPEIVVPIESFMAPEQLEALSSNWGSSFLRTYLLMGENVSVQNLEERFPALVGNIFGAEGANGTANMHLKLWSMRSYHDRNVNSSTTSYVLLAIAFAIIVIACVNFMNLSIARSMERAMEIGMRKTLGASRGQLIKQFLGESFLLSVIAISAGAWLAGMLLPVFNNLYSMELELKLLQDISLFMLLFLVALIAALMSGGYPAFVLSGFKAVETLKGALKSSPRGIQLRNALSFFQFCLAIILITGVIAVWQQVRFMKSRDLNFNPQQVLVIPMGLSDFADPQTASSRIATFKNEVLRIPGVEKVSSSMSVPGNYLNANTFARPEDWQRDEPLRMLVAGADDRYFDVYEMNFVEGRNFSRDIATESNSIIINAAAMRDMGWSTAVGKRVNDWTVIGVVEDFHYASLQEDIRPVIHIYGTQDSRNHNFISIKLNTQDVQNTLTALASQWRLLDPSRTFDYYFVDDNFDNLYKQVDNVTSLIAYFSLLSIVIANLGLLGLSSYSVVQRTKEIGVRKVLGASVPDVAFILSRQFIKPVLLANILAWPLAYLAINRWLQSFAYHVDINWIIYPFAGACILFVAMATIFTQSAKAASMNPVLALRNE